MSLTQDQVTAALRGVLDPELRRDVVTLGLIKDVKLSDDDVDVTFEPASESTRDAVVAEIKRALVSIGASFVKVTLAAKPAADAKPASALPQVRHVIAVGAGKGGVGKSTIAVNLAIGLQRRGHRVGLMDGDIYGPSMPTMLGLAGQVPGTAMEGGQRKITPLLVHGIHAISIGSLVEPEKPLMWRGPMAHGAFKQLLLDNTKWPALDYLIVDLPPGTGDVPITLCQLLPLTGAVLVATPQQVALDDAVRAARMFQQLGAPILGVVENMSVFVSPDGVEHDIFGRGGTRRAAARLGLPMLGELAMVPELRINADAGRPHANFEGNARLRDELEALAAGLEAAVLATEGDAGISVEVD